MKIGLCIVGCGGYANTVMNEIQHMTDSFQFYFASRDPQKAKEYNHRFNGSGYFGNYQDAIADPRIHAAYFFTPHHIHLQNAQLAAQHSKHILMEKPIARSIQEAHALTHAAQSAGVTLMIAENFRFLHTVQRSKKMIQNGSIGKIRLINIQAEGYTSPAAWRTDASITGGGSFIDGGIHFVHIMHHLGGFPTSIYAAFPPQIHHHSQGEDGIILTATLPNNAIGLINFSRATLTTHRTNLVAINGTQGSISFEPYGKQITYQNTTVSRTIHLPDAQRGAPTMLQEFRNSILQNRTPAMTPQDAIKDLAIVLTAYQSAAQHTPITPTYN